MVGLSIKGFRPTDFYQLNLILFIMVNFLKTHFGTMLTVLCVLLLFTACSDDEEVIDPFLKTDLIGETINLGSDAVEAFDVKVITNRRDWEIASLGVVQWCNYEIIPDGENAIIRFPLPRMRKPRNVRQNTG